MNVPVPVKVLIESVEMWAACGKLDMPAMNQVSNEVLSSMVTEVGKFTAKPGRGRALNAKAGSMSSIRG